MDLLFMDKEKRQTQINNRQEIDLIEVFYKLKSCWKGICITGLCGVLVGLLYGSVIVRPTYTSTAMVYLRSNNTATLSLQDLQVGTQLTKDYEIIFKSRPVLEKTISDLNLNVTTDTLSNMITITNPEDSRILQLSVTASSPTTSKRIVNSLMDNGIDTVSEIDSQEPYVIEKGIADTKNVSVSKKKTAVLGGFVGIILAITYILLQYILKDTISSADDVEKVLNVPVLAIVAEDEALAKAKRKKTKRGKRA